MILCISFLDEDNDTDMDEDDTLQNDADGKAITSTLELKSLHTYVHTYINTHLHICKYLPTYTNTYTYIHTL